MRAVSNGEADIDIHRGILKEIHNERCKIWKGINQLQHIYRLIYNIHPVVYQKDSISITEYMS